MSEVPDAAVEAGRLAIESVLLRSGGKVVLPSGAQEALARAVLEAALPHLAPEAPDLTAVPWRQGRSHAANLWAATSGDWQEHTPVGRMDSAEIAARACADHNTVLDLGSLLGAGWLVEMRRAPAEREDVACQVVLQKPGERVSVQFSGLTPGGALSKAREGITP